MNTTVYLLLLFSLFTINSSYSQQNDSDAIKHVIEKEVDALNRHHNLEEYLSCFAQSEKVQVGPSNDKMTIGYEAIKTNAQKVIENYNGKPNPSNWSFANWDIRVNGNTAFATCVQTTRTARNTYIDVFKSDYLEKINGEWKIADHRYFHTPERNE
jgi:SnoaL-like domain